MRKRIIGQSVPAKVPTEGESWLDLEHLAEVEVSSEEPDFPIESALIPGKRGNGWRAAERGAQLIRIVLPTPSPLHRIKLEFVETEMARTQEFVLRWSSRPGGPLSEIVRQQWTFSPGGSTSEVEDYQVDLPEVAVLELALKPDLNPANAVATLAALRIA
jgi:hypothetical protein